MNRDMIIFRSDDPEKRNILKRYTWGGYGISRFLGLSPEEKISELWFNSTQAGGLTTLPSSDKTLKALIEGDPQNMLGRGFSSKPVFCKILGKDEGQPQIAHVGFNDKISGREEDFIKLMTRERSLVTRLKDELSKVIRSEADFKLYHSSYSDWVRIETEKRWGEELAPILPSFMSGFGEGIFRDIQLIRREIVSYMNEIELKPGQVILSPTGYIHSIVGSHQMHPPRSHSEAKSEAWYIFSPSPDGKGLLYFEPQETSNTTYSPIDFPTPIEWKDGMASLRKDIRNGLEAVLKPGEKRPATDEEAIRTMSRALLFKPSKESDFVITDKAKDITNSKRYSDPVNVSVDVMIEGLYPVWQKDLFALERIRFNNGGSSVKVEPVDGIYHEIFVIGGEVDICNSAKVTHLKRGSSVFIPASFRDSYELISASAAEVLRVFPSKQ